MVNGLPSKIRLNGLTFYFIYRLFMYQDENENKPEDVRSFWIKPVTNEPGPQYYDTLKDRFVPERTKALMFVFVFVLAHEQATTRATLLELVYFKSCFPK